MELPEEDLTQAVVDRQESKNYINVSHSLFFLSHTQMLLMVDTSKTPMC